MVPEEVADTDELADLRYVGRRWKIPNGLQLIQSGDDALICEAES